MSTAVYLPLDPAWLPVMIFCARVADVSIGTLRMICIVRDRRPLAVVLSFAEVLIWLLAVTSVLAHLDQWINVLAYCGGYATGSAVGMWIESKLALGTQIVTFVSSGAAQAVAERLRFADHGVMTLSGRSVDGPVSICQVILARRQTAGAIRMARQIDPDVVATVEDVRATAGGHMTHCGPGKLPQGLRWLAGRLAFTNGQRFVAAPTTVGGSLSCDAVDDARVTRAA